MPLFSLDQVERIEFFKRDQITTDLICCLIIFRDGRWLEINEELPDWDHEIGRLSRLIGFDAPWFAKVSQPPFDPCSIVAFRRLV